MNYVIDLFYRSPSECMSEPDNDLLVIFVNSFAVSPQLSSFSMFAAARWWLEGSPAATVYLF